MNINIKRFNVENVCLSWGIHSHKTQTKSTDVFVLNKLLFPLPKNVDLFIFCYFKFLQLCSVFEMCAVGKLYFCSSFNRIKSVSVSLWLKGQVKHYWNFTIKQNLTADIIHFSKIDYFFPKKILMHFILKVPFQDSQDNSTNKTGKR